MHLTHKQMQNKLLMKKQQLIVNYILSLSPKQQRYRT